MKINVYEKYIKPNLKTTFDKVFCELYRLEVPGLEVPPLEDLRLDIISFLETRLISEAIPEIELEKCHELKLQIENDHELIIKTNTAMLEDIFKEVTEYILEHLENIHILALIDKKKVITRKAIYELREPVEDIYEFYPYDIIKVNEVLYEHNRKHIQEVNDELLYEILREMSDAAKGASAHSNT